MNNYIEELKKLPYLEEVIPLAEKDAASKGLSVFVFEQEDLKDYFTTKVNDLAVVTISKDKDGAVWNLKNFRHSYLAKVKTSNSDDDVTVEEIDPNIVKTSH